MGVSCKEGFPKLAHEDDPKHQTRSETETAQQRASSTALMPPLRTGAVTVTELQEDADEVEEEVKADDENNNSSTITSITNDSALILIGTKSETPSTVLSNRKIPSSNDDNGDDYDDDNDVDRVSIVSTESSSSNTKNKKKSISSKSVRFNEEVSWISSKTSASFLESSSKPKSTNGRGGGRCGIMPSYYYNSNRAAAVVAMDSDRMMAAEMVSKSNLWWTREEKKQIVLSNQRIARNFERRHPKIVRRANSVFDDIVRSCCSSYQDRDYQERLRVRRQTQNQQQQLQQQQQRRSRLHHRNDEEHNENNNNFYDDEIYNKSFQREHLSKRRRVARSSTRRTTTFSGYQPYRSRDNNDRPNYHRHLSTTATKKRKQSTDVQDHHNLCCTASISIDLPTHVRGLEWGVLPDAKNYRKTHAKMILRLQERFRRINRRRNKNKNDNDDDVDFYDAYDSPSSSLSSSSDDDDDDDEGISYSSTFLSDLTMEEQQELLGHKSYVSSRRSMKLARALANSDAKIDNNDFDNNDTVDDEDEDSIIETPSLTTCDSSSSDSSGESDDSDSDSSSSSDDDDDDDENTTATITSKSIHHKRTTTLQTSLSTMNNNGSTSCSIRRRRFNDSNNSKYVGITGRSSSASYCYTTTITQQHQRNVRPRMMPPSSWGRYS